MKPVREEQLFPAMEIAISRFEEIKAMGAELGLLKESLETRKLLDRAKGILMSAHGFTEQEAYRKMQQYSMNRRISIKELAEAVIASAYKKFTQEEFRGCVNFSLFCQKILQELSCIFLGNGYNNKCN